MSAATKLGEDSIKFGNCTLFRQAKSPFYNLRVMVRGKRRQFSTGESTRGKAMDKARAILADLKSRGMPETVKLHSRRVDELPDDPTLDELAAIYEKVMVAAENPPNRHTQQRYIKSLHFIGKALGISRTRSLTTEKIKIFIAEYQQESLVAGRDSESVKVSLNSILRNSAALFSKAALTGYEDRGLTLSNPFVGVKLRRVSIKGYSPLKPEALQQVWKAAVLLRDGDAAAPGPKARAGRWDAPDWRKPHVEAYLLLLLELGVGLRRNESDKAQWDWVFEDAQGRTYLEVKSTPFFNPKSKERRVIPLAKPIFDALMEFKKKDSPFIVPGRQPKALSEYPVGKAPRNVVYRCDTHHRALAHWLRGQGITDQKPCHLLRKQFGSYVATTFGLFHAQKFLGHSSPKVTSDYYAGLVDLPELNPMQIREGKS